MWPGCDLGQVPCRPCRSSGERRNGQAGEAHGASNEPGDNPHTTRLAARSLRPLRVAVLGRRLDQPRRQLGPRGRTDRGRARAGAAADCTPGHRGHRRGRLHRGPGRAARRRDARAHRATRSRACRSAPIRRPAPRPPSQLRPGSAGARRGQWSSRSSGRSPTSPSRTTRLSLANRSRLIPAGSAWWGPRRATTGTR